MIRTRTISLLSLAILCVFQVYASAQEAFPFLAEVKQNGVNVRAGGNQNFERLTQVNQGEELIVVDKNFTWYKIELPKSAAVYISDKYVTKLNTKQGTVKSDKVNLRAGPTINFSVVGQAMNGTVVDVLDYKDGWYKIEPLQTTYGWVQEDFVTYKASLPPRVIAQPAPAVQMPPAVEKAVTASVPETTVPVAASASATIEGELVSQKDASGQTSYRIVDPPNAPTLIKGLSNSLDPFVGFRIKAEGLLQPSSDPNFPAVLNVSKIQLIL